MQIVASQRINTSINKKHRQSQIARDAEFAQRQFLQERVKAPVGAAQI
jgi:hypothetical protein